MAGRPINNELFARKIKVHDGTNTFNDINTIKVTSGAVTTGPHAREVTVNTSDGHMGYTDELIFTASDFVKSAIGTGTLAITDSGVRPGDLAVGVIHDATSTNMIATKLIPKGFVIKGTSTSASITVHTQVNCIDAKTAVAAHPIDSSVVQTILLAANGVADSNTAIPFGSGVDVEGNGKNVVSVFFSSLITQLTPSNVLWGASITMERM